MNKILMLDGTEHYFKEGDLKGQFIEVLAPPKRFIPKEDEQYWTVRSDCMVTNYLWHSTPWDKYSLQSNNVFKDESEAARSAVIKKLIASGRYFFTQEEWQDDYIRKWSILYNAIQNTLEVTYTVRGAFTDVYFKSKEDVESIIKLVGVRDYKKYVLGIY